jgi:chromosomal replication initiation ATPase DnaA
MSEAPRVVLSLFRGLIEAPAIPHRESIPGSVSSRIVDEAVTKAATLYRCDKAGVYTSPKRIPYTRARQYAMWLLRQIRSADGHPRYSYPAIGRAFGRDHTTAIHAKEAVETRLAAKQARAA